MRKLGSMKRKPRLWPGFYWLAGMIFFAMIGCGGGGSGGEPVDNSKYYGTYYAQLETATCPLHELTITVGSDPEGEEGYIYLPQDATTGTLEETVPLASHADQTDTIVTAVDGTKVTIERTSVITVYIDDDHTAVHEQFKVVDIAITLNFNTDITRATISGYFFAEEDEEECWGKIWQGIVWRQPDPADADPEMTSAHLRYQFDSETAKAWTLFTKGGTLINNGDIDGLEVLDATEGAVGSIVEPEIRRFAYFSGSALQFYSGIGLTTDIIFNMPGDYTIRAHIDEGTTLDHTLTLPDIGPGELPIPIDAESMSARWSGDNLVLEWENPEETESYDRLQVVIDDTSEFWGEGHSGHWNDRIYQVVLAKDVQTLTIPAADILAMNPAKMPKLLRWTMRTEARTGTPAYTVARSTSEPVGIEYAPGVNAIATGEWNYVDGGISFVFNSSTFDNCGPQAGDANLFTVSPGPSGRMLLRDGESIQLYCNRFPGDEFGESIAGKWYVYSGESDWAMGNVYIMELTAPEGENPGSITFKGLITYCMDREIRPEP